MPLVLLVQPPIQDFYLTRKRTVPYGLASIAASLESNGFEVEILDGLATPKSRVMDWPRGFSHLRRYYGRSDTSLFSLFSDFRHFGYSFEHIGARVRDRAPFLVGISSLFTAYGDAAMETARAIKRFSPSVPVVMGGHHPTLFPEQVLRDPAVDYVIRGEGETALPGLCRALAAGNAPENVPGIALRKGDGFQVTPPHWLANLGELPPACPPPHPFYTRRKRAAIVTVSSRGCPMPCTYCSVSASSDHPGFRKRPVDEVINEIRAQAKQADIGFIDFEDENLTLNKDWFMTLLDGLDRIFPDKTVELRAMNGLYPPSLDDEIVAAMKRSGFTSLNLSLGSVSTEQLKRFRRPDVRAAHDRALDLARDHGLTCVSYVIAAAPGQTVESSLADLLYLAGRRTLAGLSVFYPAPGSLDYRRCGDSGLLPDRFSLMRGSALPLDGTTTRDQAATLMRLARILNYIKSRIDRDLPVPAPEPFTNSADLSGLDREITSERLLAWFRHDGTIRGKDKDGPVYSHAVDTGLSKSFARGLETIPLMGVEKGPIQLS